MEHFDPEGGSSTVVPLPGQKNYGDDMFWAIFGPKKALFWAFLILGSFLSFKILGKIKTAFLI